MSTQRVLYLVTTIFVAISATMGWLDLEVLAPSSLAVYALIFGVGERKSKIEERSRRQNLEIELKIKNQLLKNLGLYND